jgi:hypothetical protein
LRSKHGLILKVFFNISWKIEFITGLSFCDSDFGFGRSIEDSLKDARELKAPPG